MSKNNKEKNINKKNTNLATMEKENIQKNITNTKQNNIPVSQNQQPVHSKQAKQNNKPVSQNQQFVHSKQAKQNNKPVSQNQQPVHSKQAKQNNKPVNSKQQSAQIKQEKTSTSNIENTKKLPKVENTNIKKVDLEEKKEAITDVKALQTTEYALAQKNLDKKTSKKKIILISLSIILILLIALFCVIFSLLNINNTNLLKKLSINGIDISEMNIEDAKEKINSEVNNKLNANINLVHNEYETSIIPTQFETQYNVDEAIEKAYNIGRNGNIIQNNFEILTTLLLGHNINLDVTYNHDQLINMLNDMSNKLPDCVVQPAYGIEDTELIITNGKTGVAIDSIKLANIISNNLSTLNTTEDAIDIPVYTVEPQSVDIDKIYSEIHKEPSDAYYTTNPLVVYPHTDGLDFESSLDDVKEMLKTPQDEYVIKLKKLYANVRTSDIGLEAFPDSLSKYTTSFGSSNSNRSTNIRLASEKIDGVVLMPGETFSYNQAVGKRTAEAGFKEAAVYINGTVGTDYGGGICQVSSTLYNAVLYANLEIVERHNHHFQTGYVKAGTDATVSWGTLDFQFKNNRNYPIKLVCSGTGGKVICEIRGLYQDPEYEVEIESNVIQTIHYSTEYQKSSSKAGTVLSSGSNGCKTQAYRILKLNGEVISKTLLSTDTYSPHNKVVASN